MGDYVIPKLHGVDTSQPPPAYAASMPATAFASIVIAMMVVAIGLWVYADATRHEQRGDPVVFKVGSFVLDTPAAWCVGCLLLFVVFVPLYVTSRS